MAAIKGNDIQLNYSWDLDLIDGDLVMATGIDSIKQNVKQRLLMIKSEWFMDLRKGTDYFNKIWVKNPSLNLVESEIKSRILETQGIINLINFKLELDSSLRQLTVEFIAMTTAGELTYSEVI